MKQINIFFSIIIIFTLILISHLLVFLFSSKLYAGFAGSVQRIDQLLPFLFDFFKNSYGYFLVSSLFFTYIFYYSFINLKIFKCRNYILTIIFTPLVLSVLFYLGKYYPHVLGLTSQLGMAKYQFIQNDPAFSAWQLLIFEPKMYYLSFLVFIVIPVCITLNNQNWYLKTLVFLFLVIPLLLYIFKYYNIICLKLLKDVKDYPGLPKTADIILSISYFPFGWYLFKIANSIRDIKMRIDLEKVRKIHH